MRSMISSGSLDVGATPAEAGVGDLEVAAGRGAAAADADACGAHGEEAAGLVFGQYAGDVVVDDDDLVGVVLPLRPEDADGGTAAADAHAGLGDAVDDGGVAGLDRDGNAAIDGEGGGALVGQREHGGAGDDALALAAARQVVDAAEREHLAAVFGGGDVADGLALGADRGAFGAEVAVGVDLHLEAAIAEHAFGDDGDHVDAVHLVADDEGRGFVVGIGCAGADGGERAVRQQDEGVHAGEAAVHVAVAVAGAGLAGADAAEDGAGVAGDDGGRGLGRRLGAGHGNAWMAASTRSGVAGTRVRRAPGGVVGWRRGWPARWRRGAGSPTPLAP